MLNRPGAVDRVGAPSGVPTRGATGTFTPSLAGSDVNPYSGTIQGFTDGANWGDIRLVSNRLHGTTVSGGPPYDDSIMLFPGTWGDNISISATIYRTGDAGATTTQEVELLLCGEITKYYARFYEVMISVHATNIYADIIRWNGGGGNVIANYTIMVHQTAGVPAVADGNVFKATKVGTVITSYLDSGSGFVQMATFDVATADPNLYGPTIYTRGLPGVGLYQRGGAAGNLLDFGVTNLSITAP